MNKKIFIAKILIKLAEIEAAEKEEFLKYLKLIYKDPRKVIMHVQKFQDKNQLNRQEKIKLLGEIKKRGLMEYISPNMFRTWKLIVKNWGFPNYPISIKNF